MEDWRWDTNCTVRFTRPWSRWRSREAKIDPEGRPSDDRRPSKCPKLPTSPRKSEPLVVNGPLRYPSETGSWEVGGVDLGEFLEQYRDQQVVLIVASVGEADPDVILCGICGFPMSEAGRCPRCALAMRDQAAAFRRDLRSGSAAGRYRAILVRAGRRCVVAFRSAAVRAEAVW